jgi:hypothetical protein
VRKSDILGCWRLDRTLEDRGGIVGFNPHFGENPKGLLHYLAGDRVAVTIAFSGRKTMTGLDRLHAPIEELAEAARTFDAYAGRFTLHEPDRITHHIEIASYQNYVGTDFTRRLVLEGDRLSLHVPAYEENGATVRRWHEWRRLA